MLTKAPQTLAAILAVVLVSNGLTAHKNGFEFDLPNSTFPIPSDEGRFDYPDVWLPR